jgi:hypothetical protein
MVNSSDPIQHHSHHAGIGVPQMCGNGLRVEVHSGAIQTLHRTVALHGTVRHPLGVLVRNEEGGHDANNGDHGALIAFTLTTSLLVKS